MILRPDNEPVHRSLTAEQLAAPAWSWLDQCYATIGRCCRPASLGLAGVLSLCLAAAPATPPPAPTASAGPAAPPPPDGYGPDGRAKSAERAVVEIPPDGVLVARQNPPPGATPPAAPPPFAVPGVQPQIGAPAPPAGGAAPGGPNPMIAPDALPAPTSRPEEMFHWQNADVTADIFPTIPVTPIDMPSALSLAGVQNPQLLLAQQRVPVAIAMRQLAAAQFLPTLNLGTSYDGHTGNLQQSSGNILDVKRNSLFIGAGAVAIAAGTVNIPGVVWNQNVTLAVHGLLQAQQVVAQREWASAAARLNMTMRVSLAYLDLLETEGRRSVLLQLGTDARELARMTANYAKTGQGIDADANRAATDFVDRRAAAVAANGETLRASARLAQLLNLDTSLRLHPADNWVVPHPLVPDGIPLQELLAIAVTQRPEVAEWQAALRVVWLQLDAQRKLPFSPTIFIGFSAGEFGGGSNLVSNPVGTNGFAYGTPRFGSFYSREDFDPMAYWTLKNLGFGNRALIDAAAAQMSATDWQRLAVLEQVRMEVANAYVRTKVRLAQVQTGEQAVAAAQDSWREDLNRIRAQQGLPIEAEESLRLLTSSRLRYLAAIIDYNRAQFELYAAIGQPPADALARPALPAPQVKNPLEQPAPPPQKNPPAQGPEAKQP